MFPSSSSGTSALSFAPLDDEARAFADSFMRGLGEYGGTGPAVSVADPFPTPGALAAALNPETVQTPALDMIDRAIVDVAEGRCDRLIISMPPQEGKSERVTHYTPLWALRRNRNLRAGIVSFELNTARRWGQAIRTDIETFNGSDGQIDLGLRLRRDNRAAGEWKLALPNRGGVYSVGIGGALTGRPIDWLFIDDPVKDYKAADSEKLSEDAWLWWLGVARPRLAPGAPVVLILTRWHENDLAGRLLRKQAEDEKSGLATYDRWRVINIPAQADHDPNKGQTDPLGRQPGEYLQSARGRSLEQWETIKIASGARIWNALYQGRPAPDAGGVLQRGWWRRYADIRWSVQPDGSYLAHDVDEVITSWDMTFKDTKGSDYVVGQVWARKGIEALLLDQVRGRMDFPTSVAAVERLAARWPQSAAKYVEDKANGPAVITQLRRKVPGLIPYTPVDSKLARASAVSPFVQAGNVAVPDPSIALFDVEGFIEECAAFPNGAHDDQVDAMSQGLTNLLLRPGQGSTFVSAWEQIAAAKRAGHPTRPHPAQAGEPCPLCEGPSAPV